MPAEASCRSDRQPPLHSTTIFVYNAWQRARVCTRPVYGTQARFARGLITRECLLCWSRGRKRPQRPRVLEANVPRQAACPHRRARCSSDPMAALDTGLLQAWPRGDDGMAQAHRVYFLGTLTRNPEVRYAANGMAVA